MAREKLTSSNCGKLTLFSGEHSKMSDVPVSELISMLKLADKFSMPICLSFEMNLNPEKEEENNG